MNVPVPHEHIAGGSPLYQLEPEHAVALLALAALAVVVALRFRPRDLSRLAPIDWLLFTVLAGSSAIHVGLAIADTHHGPGVQLLFLIDAVLLAVVARRVLRGGSAGRLGVVVLLGSVVAYWGSGIGGNAPDQLGIVTKLGEILALAIIVRPKLDLRPHRVAGFTRGAFMTVLVVGTAASSWVGAFRASADTPDAVSGHHVHAGGVAAPGTVHPDVAQREPTPAERAAATQLVATARTALAKYNDPAVAAADGYHVAGMAGIDFHATNPAYEKDGRILDAAHPETLVYGVAPNGRPVLLGAMFQMPGIDQPGPAIGGPLTVWHAHEHICISLTPPSLTGILSPLGTCPFGSFDIPLTAQMIHIWIVPGAPETIGDLDDEWKRTYLRAVASRP